MKNVLTIDVEDWFHIPDRENALRDADWTALESRVVPNTHRILSLLRKRDVRATFFFLGWIAEHYPDLVRAAHAERHGIGSHGYNHEPIYRLQPAEFAEDLKRSAAEIQGACPGLQVSSYRAPAFSMTDEVATWAYPILVREGFTHGSTIFPGRRLHGGYRGPVRRVMRVDTELGQFIEVPMTVIPTPVPGLTLCFFGGGYFRVTPLPVLLAAVRYVNRRGVPVIFYLHPRDFDPDQPRIVGLGPLRRLVVYANLDRSWEKLEALLDTFEFESLNDLVARTTQGL